MLFYIILILSAPLKFRPYGAIQIRLLLLLLLCNNLFKYKEYIKSLRSKHYYYYLKKFYTPGSIDLLG